MSEPEQPVSPENGLPEEPKEATPSAVPLAETTPTIRWEDMLLELVMYEKEHGNFDVPVYYPQNVNLPNWVKAQKLLYQSSQLEPDRLEKLRRINFDFAAAEAVPAVPSPLGAALPPHSSLVGEPKKSKKKWVIAGIVTGGVIVLLVALLLVYFVALKPNSDYDAKAKKIKDKAVSILNDADQKITSFEAGKSTFGQTDTQMKTIITDCSDLKKEAVNITPPSSRQTQQDTLLSSLNDLEQAYNYYEQYVNH